MAQQKNDLARQPNLSPAKKALLEHWKRGKVAVDMPLIPRRVQQDSAPLSFAQQRLWFLDQLEPGNTSYNVYVALRLTGSLNIAVLQRSLEEIVRRHENLRTSFHLKDGHPVQVIEPAGVFYLPLVALNGLLSERRDSIVQQLAQQGTRFSFNLARSPLLSVILLRVSQDEHIMLLNMHHIVSDGWSREIFLAELNTLYLAFLQGNPSPLPELTLQYADFAIWQQQYLQGEIRATHLNYWSRQLAGIPATLNLPTDYIRPAVPSYRGACQTFQLSLALSDGLRKLSKQEEGTLFMTLLAAFQTLLFRYTWQTDIVVGTTIANRTLPEIEHLLGFFVNTLVLRTNLSGNPTFRELLRRVRRVALSAFAHQDMPFEVLVANLQPERHLSRSPLFQVMFALHNVPVADFRLADIRVTPLLVESDTAKFDLTLELIDTGQGLSGSLEYSTDLFNSVTIQWMIGAYKALLEAIMVDPDHSICDLPLLSERDRSRIVIEWNNTQTPRRWKGNFPSVFEAQVEHTPDAVALVFEDAFLTYQMLNQRANQLAHHLQKLGVRAGAPVALSVERSFEAVIGLLGILKAGGAYVPLDPEYPRDRLLSMLEKAAVAALVTHKKLCQDILHDTIHQVDLNSDRDVIAKESRENPTNEVGLEHIAYIIFTSGSTGQPKGAAVYHSGLLNLLDWFVTEFAMTAQDKTLLITSLSFDLTQKNIFAPLMTGGSVCLMATRYYDVSLISQYIAEKGITLLNCTPSMFYPFTNLLYDKSFFLLKSLKYILLGGEPISIQRLSHCSEHPYFNAEIVNTYGPTECTDVVAFHRLVYLNQFLTSSVPIGGPISHVQLFVLNENLQLIPSPGIGELYVAGDCIGAGYIDERELTASRFIPNPFAEVPGRLFYRTGDLVRYRGDGLIEYLGRWDQQVKIRGFRIELGEIEAMLAQHPGVRECVVLAREDEVEDKRLIAYVVGANSSASLSDSELRQYLQRKLPAYMLPSLFVYLEVLPLTPSGKVDRRALPVPDMDRDSSGGQTIVAQTPMEEIVAAIYCEILELKQVGIDENFFDLGGHSLLATQVVSRIRAAIQAEIPLRSMFETPTVAGLARHIEQELRNKQGFVLPPIHAISRRESLPLSFAQQRMWFLNQFVSDSSAYTLPLIMKMQGQVDIAILEKCLHEIIQRHESLRTTFVIQENHPVQVINTDSYEKLQVVDLRQLDEKLQASETHRLISAAMTLPFDLSRGPLLRTGALRTKEQETLFFLVMHHIIFDAWSAGIFFHEFSILYNHFFAGKLSPLPPLTVQYADFASWQREWLQGEVLDSLINYWTRQLEGAKALELPTDRPAPAWLSNHGAAHIFTLPVQITKDISALSRQEDVTLFMILLTAFQILLYRYTKQQDIVLGTDIANRMCRETEEIIGFFVNLLVLRIQIDERDTFHKVLRRVRTMVLDAYVHQDLPFDKLVDILQLERTTHQVPLVNVLFVLQNTPLPSLDLPGLVVNPEDIEIHTAKFDLAVFLIERKQELTGFVNYRSDLFDPDSIASLFNHFAILLQSIVSSPDMSVEDLEMLTEEEKQQQLNAEIAYQEAHRRKLKVKKRDVIVLPKKDDSETN